MAKSPLDKLLLEQAPALACPGAEALRDTGRRNATGDGPADGEALFGDVLQTAPGSEPGRTAVVQFRRALLEVLQRGSILPLQLPLLGGRHHLLVTEVAGQIAHGRVLHGRLQEEGEGRLSTITLGPDRVYGTLEAAQGTLEFEARGGIAHLFVTPRRLPPLRRRAWLLPRKGSSQSY